MNKVQKTLLLLFTIPLSVGLPLSASAYFYDLKITEIMFNSVGNDIVFEWFEVMNTGTATYDFSGYYAEDLGATVHSGFNPNIDPNLAMNTQIGPGQIAVFYDAVYIIDHPFNYDDDKFRAAWSIPASAAVIGMNYAPRMNNDGDRVGLWSDLTQLEQDTDPTQNFNTGAEVIAFNHADFYFLYDANAFGWPNTYDGYSIAYDGTGTPAYGSNWYLSTEGLWGAIRSDPVYEEGVDYINSPDDFGSPGLVPQTASPADGLIFTEIMYNPASPEPNWEWVEVYNNTGATIDFATTPYVFDDNDEAMLSAANLTSGSIPNNSVAVLYNADENNLADLQTAWGAGINFIPVADFTSLGQSGDDLAIWDSYASYASEAETGPGRTFINTLASISYDDGDDWPSDDGASSVYLTDLSQGNTTASSLGDFNGDGFVDAKDYTLWRDNLGGPESLILNLGDGDGTIDIEDYAVWVANFGATGSTGFFWKRSGSDLSDTLGYAATGIPSGEAPTAYAGGGVGSPGVFIPRNFSSIPEPSTVALLSMALLMLSKPRFSKHD